MELGDDFDVMVPADAQRLSELRRLVRGYLVRLGASDEICARAEAAVHEACANVVRHAYGPQGGPLHLHASLVPDGVQFIVSDNGTPVADPNAGRGAGLGLHMMDALADTMKVEGPGPGGTKVRLVFTLTQRAPGPEQTESERT